ncbi:fibrous sheath CABYR-binding protein isoform X1 [Seriola aureovittata]|uniref:fibrous sheath CABYR-binding protein isoform X1 n=1 Tax=Seriola aureovittata TaxID=2871759 RepID=UPI0024BEF5E4|nr:fibrous sheath CABYR-binding protein isoform X1 [Seriola aureovittata]
MSKDVDRNQVFRTTRVRTALKNDGSWIQKSSQEKDEQDEARTDHAVETKPAPVRKKSYVLSTAMKYESVDSPLSPPLEKTQLSPSEGDSANPANADVIPLQNDAQPEGSTVETADYTKPQAATEELIQNGKVQIEKIVANTAAEISDVAGTGESKDPAEVPAALAVELKAQEEPSVETDPANEAHLEDAGVESTKPSAEGSSNKCPPEHAAEDIFKAVAVVVVESSPDTIDVIHTTPGEEAALQNHVEADPDLPVQSVSESPTHCATETAAEGSCERCPPEQSTEEIVEAVAEVVVESSPETPAVNNATPRDKAALQGTVEPILDAVSESPTQSAAETTVNRVESEVESAAPTEPDLKVSSEEVIECEIQPVNNTVVEQSAEPASENSAVGVMELSIEDALEPASDTGADKLCDRAIELTDELDVEPPTAEAVPTPVEDPKQSHSEESKVNQSDTNTTEMFQKPREELPSKHTLKDTRYTSDGRAICSFCDQVIDGNIKISLNEPLVTCHPDCLQCGVCAKVLGDLLTPMFLHDQVIHCGGCFAKAFKA